MALTPEQIKARAGKMTASRVGALVSGDDTKVMNLWRELIGDPTYTPEDLSGIWPVALGSVTEQLQLDWYERKTGHSATRRGDVILAKGAEWAACTLDGWDGYDQAPIECKHVGGREPLATILARYAPQVQWQMMVMESDVAVMSIIEGAREPILERIPRDDAYIAKLWARAKEFMFAVETLTPPVTLPAVLPPVKATEIKDMHGNNEWGSFAALWLENHAALVKAGAAEKGLKALVPDNVVHAFGNGVEIKRDRASRLSLRAA